MNKPNRAFGICIAPTCIQIQYGNLIYDANKDTKTWTWFFPWSKWTYQRVSIHRPDGSEIARFDKPRPSRKSWTEHRLEVENAVDACPKSVFMLKDQDGTDVTATCHIEEREWSLGEGRFKWLRWLRANKVRRVLEVSLNTGKGPRSRTIDLPKNATPADAMKLYCAKEHTFRGVPFKFEFIH